MTMNNFFSSTLVEINSQRIRREFPMLCDTTETALRMRCECAETALQIDSQWSRSQIRQSVRAAWFTVLKAAGKSNKKTTAFDLASKIDKAS